MKLDTQAMELPAVLSEFDVWITPSLGDIRDTDRFREEMTKVVSVFEVLAQTTKQFSKPKDCTPQAISQAVASLLRDITPEEALAQLVSLAAVLFLVTGKSDNNAKCQLPLFLRDVSRWETIPKIRRVQRQEELSSIPVPRELKAVKYMRLVAALHDYQDQQERMLQEFIGFILSDKQYVSQFWSIGRSYCMLKEFGRETDLLTPLIIFQVRGSVSASGGHNPEDLLRARMREWGMVADSHFNTTDIVVGESSRTQTSDRKKTRAYDFILPYQVAGWSPRLFIQCQFYAGDSGSVSHKNVDQTASSRANISAQIPDAIFIEYLDGAGYFSSLNGDLKNLLSMPTTVSFFQIRSAAIRLRRELQAIGFLVPLEIEHATIRTDGVIPDIISLLLAEGYAEGEATQRLDECVDRGFVTHVGSRVEVDPARRPIIRRYFLLDVAACHGSPVEPHSRPPGGLFLVPGQGPFYGMPLDSLVSKALTLAPALRSDWSNPETMMQDIRWLCEEGLAISS
ncbi:MAG: hypothetical protein ISS69_13370 [Phycisphaerae bacterium]|nr:hypothetical protein [Phycisphaerae bacterium]